MVAPHSDRGSSPITHLHAQHLEQRPVALLPHRRALLVRCFVLTQIVPLQPLDTSIVIRHREGKAEPGEPRAALDGCRAYVPVRRRRIGLRVCCPSVVSWLRACLGHEARSANKPRAASAYWRAVRSVCRGRVQFSTTRLCWTRNPTPASGGTSDGTADSNSVLVIPRAGRPSAGVRGRSARAPRNRDQLLVRSVRSRTKFRRRARR